MKFLEYRIINSWQPLYDETNTKAVYYSLFDDDINDDDVEFPYGDELIDMKVEGISDTYLDALDDYIRSEILILGRDAFPVLVKFDKRKQDASGNPIVENISNPILYTRIYELEFLDGHIKEFAVNVLAENLFNRYDSDSWDMGLIDELIDIRKYPSIAAAKKDGNFITASGQERNIMNTKGCDVQILWKDQSTSWLLMA